MAMWAELCWDYEAKGRKMIVDFDENARRDRVKDTIHFP
jgi:hypothetical protein